MRRIHVVLLWEPLALVFAWDREPWAMAVAAVVGFLWQLLVIEVLARAVTTGRWCDAD